jgi:membrane associated rhomboid family serine protease
MIPIRDENPTVQASVVTFLIVGINVVVWVFVQRLGLQPRLLETVWRFGLIPGEWLGRVAPGTRVPLGDGWVAVLEGAPHRWVILTSMFMHGGWLHLIGNIWFLAIFGDNVEDAMGPVRFGLFYLICGLVAAAAQILSAPDAVLPMVGASGAIGGVMGAYLRLYPRAPVHLLVFFGFLIRRVVMPAFFMLGYWFLLQFVAGMVDRSSGGGVAFWAHVGGFAAGFLLVPVFCNPARLAACRARRGRVTRLLRRL